MPRMEHRWRIWNELNTLMCLRSSGSFSEPLPDISDTCSTESALETNNNMSAICSWCYWPHNDRRAYIYLWLHYCVTYYCVPTCERLAITIDVYEHLWKRPDSEIVQIQIVHVINTIIWWPHSSQPLRQGGLGIIISNTIFINVTVVMW